MQIPVTTSGRIHPYHSSMRPRLFSLFLVTAACAFAQETPVLSNNGDPMRVAYACLEEDLQWAGMACTEDDPCPVYLELSAIAATGREILLAGNLHSTSATLSSILVQSGDAGATWKETAARIRGSALEQVQIYDPQHAWAAGETQYPLPRDPFFLLTTDGGASWRHSTVGEEGGAGSIQSFRFDSARHGEATVDAGKASRGGRYLSFESETGGDSWTALGAGDRLPKLPPAPENPDWRIQPGKDGKSWRIEQQMGGRWSPVASFLIEVANCRLDAGPLKEPVEPK